MNSSLISRFRDNPAIARAMPFLLFIALLMLGSYLVPSGDNASGSAPWLVVARGTIVALVLLWFWPSYGELRAPPLTRAASWPLAVFAGFAVFLLWIWSDQDWAVLSRWPGFVPHDPDGSTNWPMALLRLAGFCLVVPVMEELFWRSLVLRWIERHDFLSVVPRRVGARAFIITTVLFMLEHDRWFAGAVAGAVYNALYVRTGNLWVPIAAHAVTNGVLGIWILNTGNWQFW